MLDEYARILVTGGAGFIGRHLVNTLLALRKEVTILDNFRTATDRTVPLGAALIDADLRISHGLAEAIEGAELIFHLAANANGTVSIQEPRFDFETNALGTFNLLEAAHQADVKRFIYVSSASVYGRPQRFPMDEEHPAKPFVPYGVSKLTGELYCLAYLESSSLPVVIGRPFCVYGPGENPRLALVEVSRYLRWHLNHQPVQIVGDVDKKTRDFVHVSDVVSGLLLLADKANPGEAFNIGSGEETSMRGLVETIESVTGRKAEVRELASVTEDTYRLVGDIANIRLLGYSPRVSMVEGVKQLAQELGDHPEMPSGTTIFRRGQQAEI